MSGVETFDNNGVRWILLNRPQQLNAIDQEIRAGLPAALAAAGDDSSVKAVVLSGRGRAFCAGGDVKAMGSRSAASLVRSMFGVKGIVNAIVECEKPVITALNGLASGAGASIAIASDLVLAASDAWLAFVFVELGLVPDTAASYFLPRIVGISRAKEIMMSGRRVSATEARELGIVSEIFAKETFEQDVQVVAERYTAPNKAVVPFIRRLVNSSLETDLSTALNLEAFGQTVAASLESHKQAVAGFVAKADSR